MKPAGMRIGLCGGAHSVLCVWARAGRDGATWAGANRIVKNTAMSDGCDGESQVIAAITRLLGSIETDALTKRKTVYWKIGERFDVARERGCCDQLGIRAGASPTISTPLTSILPRARPTSPSTVPERPSAGRRRDRQQPFTDPLDANEPTIPPRTGGPSPHSMDRRGAVVGGQW